jgi:hypothetical protein
MSVSAAGEISAATCGGVTANGGVVCIPAGTNDTNHIVVDQRKSDGTTSPTATAFTVEVLP